MKELKIDFDLYVKEKQDAFNKGIQNGADYAFKTVILYLQKKQRLKDFLSKIQSSLDEVNFHWEPLMKALDRNDEWVELKAFIEEQKAKKEMYTERLKTKKELEGRNE